MLTVWQKQTIDGIIERLTGFYQDSSRGGFSGSNKISEFTESEKTYFNSKFSLTKLVGVSEDTLLNAVLTDKTKYYFATFLLANDIFSFSVSHTLNGKTCFQLASELVFETVKGFDNLLLLLFKRGYRIQESDHNFTKNLFTQIASQDQLVNWCRIRFALLLNDPALYEIASHHEKVLLTIVSFKMKKPVGIHYPNLLGVANNAFLHYRDNGDILLKAMKYYNVYDEIIKRDQKKTFKYRLEEFQLYKPVQDTIFNGIILKIFPELN